MFSNLRFNIKIGTRAFICIGFMALMVIIVGVSGYFSLNRYHDSSVAAISAQESSIVGERINGLINLVVMESRGIYMSDDPRILGRFADNQDKALGQFVASVEEWGRVISPTNRERFETLRKTALDFNTFRLELSQGGRQKGNAEARRLGDNDANRTNRQALNDAVVALAKAERDHADQTMQAAENEFTRSLRIIGIASSVLMIIGLVFAWFMVSRGMVAPIRRVTQDVVAIAGGDFDRPVTGQERTDEIGEIARSLDQWKTIAKETERLKDEQTEYARQQESRATRLQKMVSTFEMDVSDALNRLDTSSSSLSKTSTRLNDISTASMQRATSVASGATQLSANVSSVATAAEQLSASVGEISRQAASAADVTGKAVEQAKLSGEAVHRLATNAEKIHEIVDLIRGIANQTNLLALNATIEAARAGEAGKGFAVVANEVKALANQTEKATGEIANQVTEIRSGSVDAVKGINDIGHIISETRSYATTIASAVEEQASSTDEINRNMRQAAVSTDQMTQEVTGVSTDARVAAEAATEINVALRDLSDVTKLLQDRITAFADEISSVR
jgi:methyl-accepting chemotaxis protein